MNFESGLELRSAGLARLTFAFVFVGTLANAYRVLGSSSKLDSSIDGIYVEMSETTPGHACYERNGGYHDRLFLCWTPDFGGMWGIKSSLEGQEYLAIQSDEDTFGPPRAAGWQYGWRLDGSYQTSWTDVPITVMPGDASAKPIEHRLAYPRPILK